MNKNLLILPILFLLTIFLVNAYDTNNLKAYYSFDDNNVLNITDSINSHNLYYVSFGSNLALQSHKTGLYGNGLNSVSASTSYSNETFKNFTGFYTINYWNYLNNTQTYSGGIYFFQHNTSNYSSTNSFDNVYRSNDNLTIWRRKAITGSVLREFGNLPTWNKNQWNMITIVGYIGSLDNLQYAEFYINGIRQNSISKTNQSLFINNASTTLTLSQPSGITDELSLWNTNLQSSDIFLLYNNGLGLDITQTLLLSNTTIEDRCVDDFTFCYNVGINPYGIYYCNSVAESKFCSGGCINDICYDTNPLFQCGTIGQKKCVDSTNIATCSDSNGDTYLDFGQINSCPINTYCVNQQSLYAECINVSQSGVHDNYALIVTPYAISDINTSYNIDSEKRLISVNTVYSLHTQHFYDIGVNYTSRSCNYKESEIYNIGNTPINTTTQFTMSSATNSNSIVRISITPNQTANGSIELFSQSSTSNGKIYYKRDSIAKSMCIYNSFMVAIYCDYDYTGVDTLSSVDLEYTYDFISKHYTLKMYFKRTYSNIKITYPIIFVGNDIYSITINSNDTILNNLSIVNIPQFTPFEKILTAYDINGNPVGNYYNSDCIFSTTGLYTIRTYGNNDGIPDYSVYTDYKLQLVGTGLTTSEVANRNDNILSGFNLSKTTKYLVVLLTLFIIIGTGTGIGFSIQNVSGGFTIGVVLAFFGLIMFTVFGWIPAWVLVTMIIIGIATIILVSKTSNDSSSGV